MFQIKVITFIIATAGIFWVSRSSLRHFRSHGFYRFFAWESILTLIVLNLNYWIRDPFSIHQIISWSLLLISLFLVFQGFISLKQAKKSNTERSEISLMTFEKTTELLTTGVYRYIRHPLYSSLLFLAWGALFKHISWTGIVLAALSTFFLCMTARREEAENLRYFGKTYQIYMKKTRMFIPFLF
jgi:protein-S-isoprenylcysteine O-methyltransferase Ste14